MKTIWVLFLGVFAFISAIGQDAAKQKADSTEAKEKPKLSQEQLEAAFRATLTKATLSGRWCSVNEGRLGSEKKDQYTILEASKVKGDSWLLKARIQYGNTDLVAPVPVQVKWAGDTAVIIVDDFAIPGSNTYSARVMVHEHTYAGTWSGGDHGGLLSGVITNEKE